MPYCRNCGTRVDPSDAYCFECGAALPDRSGGGRSDAPEASSRPYGEAGADGTERQDDRVGGSRQHDRTSGHGQERSGRQPDQARRGRQSDQARHSRQSDRPPRRETHGARSQQQPQRRQPPATHSRRGPSGEGYRRRGRRSRRQQGRSGSQIEDGKTNYAFSLPTSDGYIPLVFGSLCNFLSFLIVPIFTLNGYVFRLTEAAAEGRRFQPPFEDPVDLTVRGFLYSLLYFSVAAAGVLLVAGSALGLAALTTDAVGGVAAIVLGLGVLYVLPAIMTLYPATGRASKALSPKRILDFAVTGTYFVSFLGFVLLILGITIATMLLVFALFITIIGIFAAFPLLYAIPVWIQYVAGSYWGATYYTAVQDGLVMPPNDGDETAEAEPESQGRGHQEFSPQGR